jgi:hypothetical protein
VVGALEELRVLVREQMALYLLSVQLLLMVEVVEVQEPQAFNKE